MSPYRCLCLLLLVSAPVTRPSHAEPLTIATFNVDATPPLGSPVAYARARKILDRLSARGIILLSDEKPIVLCAVDWIGIGNGGHDLWREKLAQAAATTVDRVAVHTLHQHDAPRCDFTAEGLLRKRGLGGKHFDADFARRTVDQAARAIREALEDTKQVTHLGVGRAKVEKVASNRRILGPDGAVKVIRWSRTTDPEAIAAPEGLVDPYLRTLSLYNGDQPLAALTYYATHPQSYYGQGDVTTDFVGIARALRESELPGVAHIHFNGAGGNVTAGKYNDGSERMRPILAKRLAGGMRMSWESTVKTPITASDVEWRVRKVKLPVGKHLAAEKLLEVLDDTKADSGARLSAASDLAWVERNAAGRRIAVTCLRLDRAYVLHLPGESFVEYQLAAQRLKPESPVCVAAYGDYGPGYIGTEIAYSQGGYETSPRASRVAPRVEHVLMKAIQDLLSPERGDEVLLIPRSDAGGENLLENPQFEAGARGWSAYGSGFDIIATGRSGKAIRAQCRGRGHRTGAVQRLELRLDRPVPVLVSGWSQADGVDGAPGPDYSIYVDAIYSDGTPLWGQTGNFRPGTHGWQKIEFIVAPAKPIKTLTVYTLLRNRRGTASFDDLRVVPLAGKGDGVFEGAAYRAGDWKQLRPGPGVTKGAGGALRWSDDGVPAPGGIAVRDVAAGSGFLRPRFRLLAPGRGEAMSDLGLKVSYEARPRNNNALELTVEVEEQTGRDRAVTVLFAVAREASKWWDDAAGEKAIQTPGLYQFVAPVGVGAAGTSSYYPLGCVQSGSDGIALANPMDAPRIRRYAYDARWKLLYAAFDFGLTREQPRADLKLAAFTFPPRWGFRAAWAAYQKLYPHLFTKRVREEGLWMAFLDIAGVENCEDFGFAFKEGTNNVPFDDRHGILTFRYTEPQSHWQRMPKEADRSYQGCVELLERRAREGDKASAAALASAVRDEKGRFVLDVRDTPWCDGCVFTLNPNPRLPGELTKGKRSYSVEEADRRYQSSGHKGLDGEYLDSLEGWSLARDFYRSHFACSTVPLSFDTHSRKPCVLNAFNIYEFTRFVAEDIHRRGKLLMANSTPYRFPFLLPLLDHAGVEINWKRGGRYNPDPEWWMNYRRALSGKKPYLFLMNTDFTQWSKEDSERYMRRSLFYGFYPSFFSADASTKHYFSQPTLYNRDRPLFRRYVPWIRRLGVAGWEVIPHATAEPAGLRVERYGPDAQGKIYWTVLNTTSEALPSTLALELGALGLADKAHPLQLRKPLTGETLREGKPEAVWRVSLPIARGDTELLLLEPAI